MRYLFAITILLVTQASYAIDRVSRLSCHGDGFSLESETRSKENPSGLWTEFFANGEKYYPLQVTLGRGNTTYKGLESETEEVVDFQYEQPRDKVKSFNSLVRFEGNEYSVKCTKKSTVLLLK